MSWRKIEKVWDEVRAAQQPKRNLSKQPKKSKEVKLSVMDELTDAVSIAFDNEREVDWYKERIQEMEQLGASVFRIHHSEKDTMDWKQAYIDLNDLRKKISDTAKDLGVDFDAVSQDYSESDVDEAFNILTELSNQKIGLRMAIEDVQNEINKLNFD
jgi:Mg2+ and Co2+ transporter CorA